MLLLGSFFKRGERIDEEIAEVHKIISPGGWSKDYRPKPRYWLFINRHERDIQAVPEFSAWLEAMRADESITKHLDNIVSTVQGGIRRTAWEYAAHLLVKQFSAEPTSFEFDANAFDRCYLEMERFFFQDVIEFRAFSPLQNFSADVEVIDLGGGLRIRKIVDQELEELLDASALGSTIPFGEIPNYRYAMEAEYELQKLFRELKVEDLKATPDQEFFGKLVTALRLFKPGTLGFNIVKTIPVADTPGVFGGTRSAWEYKRFWGPKYSLTGGDVEAFKEFWNGFRKVDLGQQAAMGVAIRRFNFAYERLGLEDKLIDLMIGFEALFFKSGEFGENRHKLALRVARLLSEDYETRKRIAKEVAAFYDTRNLVVHGELVTLKPEFITKIEDVLRDSIKYFLGRPRSMDHDEIISRLDLS